MTARAALLVVWGLALAAGCGGSGGGGSSGSSSGATTGASAPAPQSGLLDVLTYNVAGLPDFLSQSAPRVNTPLISPLLNRYDLVLAQEDFVYHHELARQATHAYRSTPLSGQSRPMNDGLNQFSDAPFSSFVRRRWTTCHGMWDAKNDCLAEKGFTRCTLELAPGIEVDVYNLHADAGSSYGDIFARSQQYQELAAHIATHSAGKALLVAGDTNLTGFDAEDEPVLQTFMGATGLTDACRFLACGNDRIDRVLFRSTPQLTLVPVSWRIGSEFIDAQGAPLSDHKAVNVLVSWTYRP